MSIPYSRAPEAGAPTIVGLDLSLASTGVAVIEPTRITVTRVKTGPGSDTTAVQVRRLELIVELIREAIPFYEYPVVHVAVEGPAFASNTPGAHMRGGLWWMVRSMLAEEAAGVAVVSPASVKKYATGRGNAKKDEVLAAVIRRYPDVDVKGNDEADALVLAAMCARELGHSIDTVPQASLDAMKGVKR